MKQLALIFYSMLILALPSSAEDEMNKRKLNIKDADAALREKNWDSCSAIAVGNGYSVALQTKSAHPFLAEYFQRVLVFAGTARDGKLSGALQLRMNTGGRTHALLYRHLDKKGVPTHVSCEDRYGIQTFRLKDLDFEDAPETSKKEYLGTLSGEAYPLKFLTPVVLSEGDARKEIK